MTRPDRIKADVDKAEKNIAVAGCGHWGKNLVRNFAELGVLRSICDIDAAKLRDLNPGCPSVNRVENYSKLLKDEAIKGVAIATPPVLHYSMAREALLAGKDVLVEKPLSLNWGEGKELVELAEEQGRILLVGHLLEYHPAVQKLKELVDSGELGRIQYIYSNRLNLGKFRTQEDILWSFAPHDISVILLLLGGEMPYDVNAHGSNCINQNIADATVTFMNFKSGVKAHIFVSWLHPYKEQKLVIIGDKKMAEFNDTNSRGKLLLFRHEIRWMGRNPIPNPGKPEVVEVPDEEPLKIECQDFIRCLKTREKPTVDGHKGLQVLHILSHCHTSIEENGRTISLTSQDDGFFVHETSLVEKPCRIGKGTRIWHFSHIMPDVSIGTNCVIGQNIFVGRGVTIGNSVKIENNVSVFEGVTLEDDVFCGPSCNFTNVINPRSHVPRKNDFKPILVRKGATIGANATIICGHTIGKYAFVGAGAVVTRDIPDYALVYGNPARMYGWVCECGTKLEKERETGRCLACGQVYKIEGGCCSPDGANES